MSQMPLVIDQPPTGISGRARQWLRRRRLALAAGLGVAELILYLVWSPSKLLGILAVGAILVLALMTSGRLRPGLGRDLVLVMALAQALVIALPVALFAFSLVAAVVLVVALIALFLVIALRFRF